MNKRVLLAGASGTLGRWIARELQARGYRVRALVRDKQRALQSGLQADELVQGDILQPESLPDIIETGDIVVSALGASLQMQPGNWRSYMEVDFRGNANLIGLTRAKAAKFVYVSVYGADEARHLEYMEAHERIADMLQAEALPSTIIRPTGFFSAFGEILRMARYGIAIQIGDGTARSNPVHEADVAAACVQAIEHSAVEIAIGGPEVFSRAEINAMAFRALNRPARILRMSPAFMRIPAAASGIFNPRLRALIEFSSYIFTHDCLAPQLGTRRMERWMYEQAQAQ